MKSAKRRAKVLRIVTFARRYDTHVVLHQFRATASKPFRCGDDDLDEFFTDDAFLQSDELLSKNYCFTLDADPSAIVAAFTLSNDSIKKIPGSRKKKVEKNIPREKQYSSYPAVMIGRLGISTDFQSSCLAGEIRNCYHDSYRRDGYEKDRHN